MVSPKKPFGALLRLSPGGFAPQMAPGCVEVPVPKFGPWVFGPVVSPGGTSVFLERGLVGGFSTGGLWALGAPDFGLGRLVLTAPWLFPLGGFKTGPFPWVF